MTLPDTSVNRNHNSIDLFKIIMAFLVVAAHTHPIEGCTNRTVMAIYGQVTQMTVLFFFLSSGYLLSEKLALASDVALKISITTKYLCKILKMYVVWSLIYLPLAIFAYWKDNTPFLHSVADYIRGFVLIGEHYNSWQLWYLLSTIYALILVIILLRLQWNVQRWPLIIGAVCLLSIFMTEVAESQEVLPVPLHIIRSFVSITTVSGRILHGSIFIPVGILMFRQNLSTKTWLILFSVSFLADVFIENTAVSKVLLFLSAIALFGVIIHIDLKNHYIYKVFRNLSTDIYLIHMYIFSFYCSLIHKEVHFGWDSFLVTAILSLAVGLLHLRFTTKKKAAAS